MLLYWGLREDLHWVEARQKYNFAQKRCPLQIRQYMYNLSVEKGVGGWYGIPLTNRDEEDYEENYLGYADKKNKMAKVVSLGAAPPTPPSPVLC